MTTPVLFFGTLRDAALRRIVLGADIATVPAVLPGRGVRAVAGAEHPVLVAAGAPGTGELAHLPDAMLDRVAFHAAGTGQVRDSLAPDAGGPEGAVIFRPETPGPATDAPWSLGAWQADWGPMARHAAAEAMEFHGRIDAATLAARMGTIRVRAHSAVRAAASTTPATLRSAMSRDAVRVIEARRPYTHFFAVQEADLTHPHFDGGRSDVLTRAGFVSGDAVTVLPYDPERDRVMVIEQFRMGPYLRGDPRPWALEPIAGRIDPGETAETAARREAREEAHLEIGALHHVANYYPSPGALSEYIDSYVGLAELPDGAAGLGGEASEGEDIRGHVLAFDRFMEMIDTGEADTAPLILTALWLDRARRSGRFG